MKVFCLGMSKTGTTSLHAALQVLGLRSCHHVHRGRRGRQLIEEAVGRGDDPLAAMPGYDAYSDMGLYDHLEQLDRWHPGARWVDTVRDPEPWVRSLVAHNERRMAAGEVEDRDVGPAAQERWLDERRRVEATIAAFFADRPGDLLTMDVVGGDGWEALCPFLGLPAPDEPFPHRNRRPEPSLATRARSLVQRVRGGST